MFEFTVLSEFASSVCLIKETFLRVSLFTRIDITIFILTNFIYMAVSAIVLKFAETTSVEFANIGHGNFFKFLRASTFATLFGKSNIRL